MTIQQKLVELSKSLYVYFRITPFCQYTIRSESTCICFNQ